jgi:ribosomal-protein-alanine N-acetyltransferase
MVIRPMTEADLEAVGRIQSHAPTAAQWPPRDYLDYSAWVADEDGQVTGFLVLQLLPGAEAEILNLAVDPSQQRKGIATQLLKLGPAASQQQLHLEVRESNHPARTFYRVLGFDEIHTRRNYYHDPPEPGIVMRLKR